MNVTATYGVKRSRRTWATALAAAIMLITMLLAQLFEYEDFLVTLGALLPFNDAASTKIVGASIIIMELLALPFLLNMYLSMLMRIVSACFAVAASTFWLIVALTNAHASNSGIFSTTIELQGGVAAATWTLLLFGAVIILIRDDTRNRNTPLEKKAKLE